MKKIILLCIFLIFIFITGCTKNSNIESDIISFEYNYGSYNSGYYSYSIFFDDDKVLYTAIGKNGIDLDVSKEIDEATLLQLSSIINKNKIYKWDGFNESDANALDGNSFNLKIKYKDGTKITASGNMKYPKNYDKGHKVLKEFLNSLK